MADDIQQRFAFAEELADAAGAIIRPYFRRRIEVSDKGKDGFYDPVTEADRRAEQVIRQKITGRYPQDGIIGEEFGSTPGTSGFVWVIDPIDGTRAFLAGQPLWGTLIGLEHDGRALAGILDQPFLQERFVGHGGKADFRDRDGAARLNTRACATLAEAVICTTHPLTHFTEDERARFRRVEKECRLSRYGGDCYAYGLLAMGFLDIVIEAGLKHWDIAAIFPLIEGAGGVLTAWNGGSAAHGGNVVAAGDRRTHAQAVHLLTAQL
jgi:histidinol phosphatase-like enzyme (inositol monophosphatase family)